MTINADLYTNIALPVATPRQGGFVHLVDTDGTTHLRGLIESVIDASAGTCEIAVLVGGVRRGQQATHDENTKPANTWHWPD